jgi:hypothetical protein
MLDGNIQVVVDEIKKFVGGGFIFGGNGRVVNLPHEQYPVSVDRNRVQAGLMRGRVKHDRAED